MLIRRSILEAIVAGRVTAAFRRWRRPTVRAGGRLRSAVGELAIDSVEPVEESMIREEDARRAGYSGRAELLAELHAGREGTIYHVRLHFAGADPRVALCRRSMIPEPEFAELRRRLSRLDAAARTGPWTLAMLRLIAARPERPAGELAAHGGFEKEWLKLNVRKLRELGLTESLQPGYRLSPRGRAALDRLIRGDDPSGESG